MQTIPRKEKRHGFPVPLFLFPLSLPRASPVLFSLFRFSLFRLPLVRSTRPPAFSVFVA